MKFCPHCGGDIAKYMAVEERPTAALPMIPPPTTGKYDPVLTWKRLVAEAASRESSPPSHNELVEAATANIRPGEQKLIVHLAFDRDIVPRGGVLHKAALLEGRTEMSEERLSQMGYAVHKGHLVTVDEIPVGPAYQVIDYWGGAKQHRRWHMKYAADVVPSRGGDPFFMDENMIAFGTTWKDTQKMEEAFLTLLLLFESWGEDHRVVARPLAFELALQ